VAAERSEEVGQARRRLEQATRELTAALSAYRRAASGLKRTGQLDSERENDLEREYRTRVEELRRAASRGPFEDY
jgi:hypothetical protein